MIKVYNLDNLFTSSVDEILFIKIKNGRYKVVIGFEGMGVVYIPQSDICSTLGLLYDKSCDSIIISNIRYRSSIVKSITERKVKVVMI